MRIGINFLKKVMFWRMQAFAPGLPIIATDRSDYRQSRCKRPQTQSLFASFSSEKEGLHFRRLRLPEPIML